MKSREPKYVTFEQAMWLKEKDFDVEVQWAFDQNGGDYKDEHWDINYNSPSYNCYSKPEQHQVVEWLRVNHGIWISCYPTSNPLKCQFRIYKNDNGVMGQVYDDYMGKEFNSPQEAYSAAFDYIEKEGLI